MVLSGAGENGWVFRMKRALGNWLYNNVDKFNASELLKKAKMVLCYVIFFNYQALKI